MDNHSEILGFDNTLHNYRLLNCGHVMCRVDLACATLQSGATEVRCPPSRNLLLCTARSVVNPNSGLQHGLTDKIIRISQTEPAIELLSHHLHAPPKRLKARNSFTKYPCQPAVSLSRTRSLVSCFCGKRFPLYFCRIRCSLCQIYLNTS